MIGAYIKLILLVSGIATAGMIAAFLAPALVLDQLFVAAPKDAVSLAVTRHWGVLVFCFGVLLIYAAFRAQSRQAVLAVTIVEKIALVAGPAPSAIGASLRRLCRRGLRHYVLAALYSVFGWSLR